MNRFEESQHPRGDGGRFAAKPASETNLPDLVSQERAAANECVRELSVQVREDFPDARSVVIENSEMGAFVESVRGGDGTVLATSGDIDSKLHESAEELVIYGEVSDFVEPGEVDEGTGVSRDVVHFPQDAD